MEGDTELTGGNVEQRLATRDMLDARERFDPAEDQLGTRSPLSRHAHVPARHRNPLATHLLAAQLRRGDRAGVEHAA